MITKKLLHDIITFCNNYIDNKNIVYKVAKFPEYIYVCINIVQLYKNNTVCYCIDTIDKLIYTKEDFIKYKQEVLKQLPTLLKQIKRN